MPVLGNELRKLRQAAGLTQEELAFRAGIHRTYVSQLERNQKSPTLDVLFSICKVLTILPSELIAKVESGGG